MRIEEVPDALLTHLEDPVALEQGGPDAAQVEVDLVQMFPVAGAEEILCYQVRRELDTSVVPVVLLLLIGVARRDEKLPIGHDDRTPRCPDGAFQGRRLEHQVRTCAVGVHADDESVESATVPSSDSERRVRAPVG